MLLKFQYHQLIQAQKTNSSHQLIAHYSNKLELNMIISCALMLHKLHINVILPREKY